MKKTDAEKIRGLLGQLSKQPIGHDLEALVEEPSCHTFVVEHDGEIVGTASLIIYSTPTKGRMGRVEDVVVDGSMRGLGLGRTLMDALIDMAKEKGVRTIDLTSNKTRSAARGLYESMGFEYVDTDVFRLQLH